MKNLKYLFFVLLAASSFQILAAEALLDIDRNLDIGNDSFTYKHLVTFATTMEQCS